MDTSQKTQSHRKPRIHLPKKFSSIRDRLVKHARSKRKTYFGLAGVLLILVSTLIYNFAPFFQSLSYELSPKTLELIGEVRDDAKDYLKQNDNQSAYEFIVPDQNNGSAEHTGRVEDAFSANFSINPKDGVSITEKDTNVSIKLIPKFVSTDGKMAVDKQIVYPFGKNQLVYSLKYNGLKEDIIIPEYAGNELSYEFDLVLPVGAEARLDNGSIGIYAADSKLFGEMNFGSDSDRELVEKARESAEKNNLITVIPAPIVKESSGKVYEDRSEFKLGERKQITEKVEHDNVPEEVKAQLSSAASYNVYELTLNSKNLKELSYPISIDPTFQVTSASDFADTTLNSGVEIDNSGNLIRRGALTGGTVNGWGSTTSLPSNNGGMGTATYNGYIYTLGGTSGVGDVVNYAKLNTNGSIESNSGCGSSWCTTTSLTSERTYFGAAAYNGYMYIAGGRDPSVPITIVEYAKINADGTLGSWTTGPSLPTTRQRHPVIIYNGYLYVIGGQTSGGGNVPDVDYARLNADGSIAADSGCASSWCSGVDLPRNTSQQFAAINNGVIYSAGGLDGGTATSEVLMSYIGSDGAPGSWSATSSLNTIRSNFSGGNALIYNGYIYIAGGCSSGTCDPQLSSTEYAPINADGTLGTWRITGSLNTARGYIGLLTWGGYLYSIGGCISFTTSCAGFTNTVEYTSIRPAGELEDGTWSTASSLNSTRRLLNSTVYNGVLYTTGGWGGAVRDTLEYAPINADGSLGSWTTDGDTFANARMEHGFVIANGYAYIAGGVVAGGSGTTSVQYATVNDAGGTGAWAATTALPLELETMGMVTWGGYIYIIGGNESVGASDDVYRAAINSSDGTLGSWSDIDDMPAAYTNLEVAAHVYNGYLYLVGGCNSGCPGPDSDYNSTVRYAPILNNGDLDSWTVGTSFTGLRNKHMTTIYNGYIYVIGGQKITTTATTYSDVQYAPINSDGSVGTFTTSGATTNTDIYMSSIVAHNGFMYIIGGRSSATNQLSTVEYMAINNGGRGGPTSFTSGTFLSSSRKNHASVTHNGRLYVLGGCTDSTCSTVSNVIQYAELNSNGSIVSWGTTTSFTTARRDLYAFTLSNRMYVVGGRDGAGTMQNSIEYATIAGDGTIGSWTTDGTSLPSAGANPGTTVYGNALYMLGGESTPTTTSYAVVDTGTGDVGSFTTTTALPEGRYQMWAFAYRGYIYAIGGNSASGRLRSVYYAQLNGNNTIGTWRRANSEINQAANAGTLTSTFVSNGYMYLGGGEISTGFYNNVQFAAIGSNGDLGPWQLGSGTSAADHGNYPVAQWNGKIYTTGGQRTSPTANPSISTYYAGLQAIPHIGSFSKVYRFEAGVRPESLITRGSKRTGAVIDFMYANNVACDNSDFSNSQSFSNLSLGSANRLTINLGGPTLASCLLVDYEIDDRYSAVFPDAGAQTYITNFELYYIANPSSRLKSGRTFTNGIERGLHASPQ